VKWDRDHENLHREEGAVMQTRICPECGILKPEEEFRIRRAYTPNGEVEKLYRVKVCKVCEVDRRIRAREANPYLFAFRHRRRNHARSLGLSVDDLRRLGWDEERRSIEMEAAFEFGYCPHCIEIGADGKAIVHHFRDLDGGLRDLTIDVINPGLPPQWPGNVQFLCSTCNSRKHSSDPILHGQRLQAEFEFGQVGGPEPLPGQLDLF
jgi:5-methylcytosine-specific restriction endonuclease McrA